MQDELVPFLIARSGQALDACTDLATLERWHDQAVTAASISEALH